MDDWLRDVFRLVGAIGTEVERVLADVSQDVEQMADLFLQASEYWVDHLEKAMAADIDHLLTTIDQSLVDLVEPIATLLNGLEEAANSTTEPIVQIVEPMMQNHPACIGCRHYHGQVYGDNLLVCAMHPYGWDASAHCPDWESLWTN